MGINSVTGDNIISKASKTYADNYDAIFRKDKDATTSEVPAQDTRPIECPEQRPLPRHCNSAVEHFLAGEGLFLGEHYY